MSQFDDALLFKTIVDHGSLARAGEQLGINASAVSKRLANLERQLDTQLLRRTTRRLTLTESGQYFYQELIQLHSHWQSALDETSSLGNTPKGTLRIATPQPVASRFLLPLLTAFQAQYPHIHLQLMHEHYESLPAIDADITICRELSDYQSSTVAASVIYHYHNRLFASPDYIAQHSAPNNIKSLSEHWGLRYGHHEPLPSWQFTSGSVQPRTALLTNNTEVLISAATQGLGIAYIPSVLIEQELARGDLIAILPEARSRTYSTCAYFNKSDVMAQKVSLLIAFLKKSLGVPSI